MQKIHGGSVGVTPVEEVWSETNDLVFVSEEVAGDEVVDVVEEVEVVEIDVVVDVVELVAELVEDDDGGLLEIEVAESEAESGGEESEEEADIVEEAAAESEAEAERLAVEDKVGVLMVERK
jgi:hypothetical protein